MIDKLHIGCGYERKKGYINIDKAKEVNPEMIVDIEEGLPFPDNSFREIYSYHCLEHIRPDKWKFVLNEIARVAKDNCILDLHLPFDNPLNNIVDHYRLFSWGSFGCISVGEDTDRTYYSDLVLEPLIKEPNRYIKLIIFMFPYLKKDIHFKFRIKKKEVEDGK